MILCNTLNKGFASKDLMFDELKAKETQIIDWKRSKIYKSANKNQISDINFIYKGIANKAFEAESGYIYPVINTTRYLDSHDDVHLDNLFKKSIQEQKGKIDYVDSHSPKITDVIVWRTKLEVFTSMLDWQMVGKDYPGQTQALIYKFLESDIVNDAARKAIEQRWEVQGSVSMQYVKIKLAVNSSEKKYKENKQYFDSTIDQIANKDNAIEQGFYFGVTEAKIIGEGSMVLRASNDATEMIYPDDNNMKSQTNEPPEGTRKQPDKSTENGFEDFLKYMNKIY